MDAVLLAIAFLFGLIAQQLRLPPLVGFLISGFVLQAFGQKGGDVLHTVSELGVTLMLFTIGVKLRVRTLARPEIWAGTSLHTLGMVLLIVPILLGAGTLAGHAAAGLDWQAALLLSFALAFSSTVFTVKSLEESGDMGAMHGRIAVGMLIMQDILAVVFLTCSKGKLPSLWAIPLIALLFLCRRPLGSLIARSGHGEMTTLCGLFLALVVGAKSFEMVDLKADLGALFVGILVGSHPRAKEMGKSLMGLTDLFLIGFFLQIGLEGSLSAQGLWWALLLVALLPLKGVLFFGLLTRFHLRARTSWMAGLSLSTYSEFGLIVISLAVGKGWLGPEWLVAMAVALSLSILIAAPANRKAEELYDPISDFLKRFETAGTHPDDLPIETKGERIAIFGMGRVGMVAYKNLESRYPGRVIGFDRDPLAVSIHQEAGRNVLLADATDSDFWERVRVTETLDLVILAMPKHSSNVHAARTLKRHNFEGVVTAIGKFDDEVKELRSLGLDTAFNLYNEAGSGFSDHVVQVFSQQRPDLASEWRKSAAES